MRNIYLYLIQKRIITILNYQYCIVTIQMLNLNSSKLINIVKIK